MSCSGYGCRGGIHLRWWGGKGDGFGGRSEDLICHTQFSWCHLLPRPPIWNDIWTCTSIQRASWHKHSLKLTPIPRQQYLLHHLSFYIQLIKTMLLAESSDFSILLTLFILCRHASGRCSSPLPYLATFCYIWRLGIRSWQLLFPSHLNEDITK